MNRNRGYNPYNLRGGNPYHYSQSARTQTNNLLNTIHELIISYNENIRFHNHIMEDYNHNIFNILNLIHHIHGNINVNNYNQSGTNTTRPFPSPGNPNRTQNNIDLSTLLYLLNIPVHMNFDSETRHIVLTQEQIDNSTIIVNYNNESFTETTCPISLDDFEVDEEICQIVGCGHYFKKNHIMRWFQTNHFCPVCRYNILGNQPQSTSPTNRTIPTENMSDPPPQSVGSPLQTRNDNLRIPLRNRNSNSRFSDNNMIINSLNTSSRSDNNVGIQSQLLPPLRSGIRSSYENFSDILSEPNLSRRNSANIGEFNSTNSRLPEISRREMNENEAMMENVSRMIGEIILEQIPLNSDSTSSIDTSNNLMFSFEIPYRSI